MFRSFGIYALIFGTIYSLSHFVMDYKRKSFESKCKLIFVTTSMQLNFWHVFLFLKDSMDGKEHEISVKGME